MHDPEVKVKEGVLLKPGNWNYHTGLIIKYFAEAWPCKNLPIVITRGSEQCPGGAAMSKHLVCKAFDFRAKHLPGDVDRQTVINRALELLGPNYWGYYKKNDVTEWFHIGFMR